MVLLLSPAFGLAILPIFTHAITVRKPTAQNCDAINLAIMSPKAQGKSYFWSNKNGDSSCSGATSFVAPSKLDAGPAWSYQDSTASIVSHHPCIDDEGNIYLIHRHGVVRKFSPNSTIIWTNYTSFKGVGTNVLTGGPAIMNGLMYIGLTDGSVVAHDMADGTLRWKVKHALTSGIDSWSMAAFHGMVFAAVRREFRPPMFDVGGNDRIIAMDGRDGKLLWHWDAPMDFYNWIGSFVDSPPSIVFADMFGHPVRIRLCDGKTLWTNTGANFGVRFFSTGGAIVGSNGKIYVTSNNWHGMDVIGRLSAYDSADGKLLWTQELPMQANNAPVIGQLKNGNGLSVVIAMGMNPGLPDPVADATGIWFGGPLGFKSMVQSFDATTGKRTNWTYTPPVYKQSHAYGDHFPDHICLPDAWSNGAIGGDGTFYVGHMSGNMFAIKDINGDGFINETSGEVSRYFGHRCYQGSPAIAQGMLVTAPCDGMHVFHEL